MVVVVVGVVAFERGQVTSSSDVGDCEVAVAASFVVPVVAFEQVVGGHHHFPWHWGVQGVSHAEEY